MGSAYSGASCKWSGVRSRVAVFAIDEGILQVARYRLGDPLDHFFQKRMLEVSTSQILDQILPEFARLTGMAAPGGDGDSLLGKNLNPFKKKRKPPVAWWSGIVEVDGHLAGVPRDAVRVGPQQQVVRRRGVRVAEV